jgi:hypothetical protein
LKKRYQTHLWPLLEPNGFLAFHDAAKISSGAGYAGVIELIKKLMVDKRIEYVEMIDSIVVFKKN